MIIAVRHANAGKGTPAITRSIETGIQHVNLVGIFGIGIDARVIPCALPEISLLVGFGPAPATVVGAKHAAVFGFNDGPQTFGIRGRDSNADDANRPARQTWIA